MRRKRTKIVFVMTPRLAMGWPCFYCGKPIAKCKETARLTGTRCCVRCDNQKFPTAAH